MWLHLVMLHIFLISFFCSYRLHVRKLRFLLRFYVRLNFCQTFIFYKLILFWFLFFPLLEFLCTIKLVSVIEVINIQQSCHHYWRLSKENMDWAALVIHKKHLFQFSSRSFRHDYCKHKIK